MKKYFLITAEYSVIDECIYHKFSRDNKIALICSPNYYYFGEKLSPTEGLKVRYAIIDVCDGVFVAKDYETSEQAKALLNYAKSLGKEIRFESKQWGLRKEKKND